MSFNIILKVANDIERSGNAKIMQAAQFVRKEIVASAKAKYPKVSGDLFKGVAAEKRSGAVAVRHVGRRGVRTGGDIYAVVGLTAPAYHGHLLEFGTKDRVVKNFMGRGKSQNVGRVQAKPFVAPAFEKSAPIVEEILSGTWVN